MTSIRRSLFPLIILLAGVGFIILGLRDRDSVSPNQDEAVMSMPVIQESLTDAFRQGVPEQSIPSYPSDQFLHDLLESALWESEAAATRAAKELRAALLEKIEEDSGAFLEKLYNLSTTKKELTASKEKHRTFVADKMFAELNANQELNERLAAISFQFLHDLERIAQEVAIQSGLDVEELPAITLSIDDFDGMLRDDLRLSSEQFASSARSEGRTSVAIGTVSMGVSLFLPTKFLVDLTIGFAVDSAIEQYRDANTRLEAKLNHSLEELADRICFGDVDRPGLYAAFLDVAYYHNNYMTQLIARSRESVELEKHEIDPIEIR